MLLAHSNVFQNGMSQSCSTNDHVLYIKGLDHDQVPASGFLCNTPMKKDTKTQVQSFALL